MWSTRVAYFDIDSADPGRRAQLSSKTYSCWASRTVSVRLLPGPTPNSTPLLPGDMVRNETQPSGFLREPTSPRHSPKSKIVAPFVRDTLISPSAAFV